MTRRLGVFVLATAMAGAAEHAMLKSGFRMSADRIEKLGSVYRLHTRAGAIELAASDVESIEQDDFVAPAPTSSVAPVAAAIGQTASAPPQRSKPATVAEMIEQAAERAGIPAELVHSVAKAESNYQVNALSHKGAIGVMQLMPATAAALSVNPHDPEQNIDAGARYLRDLLIKYDGDSVRALAAYNAGPAAVDRYRGVPPYRETVTYVDRVLRNYARLTANPSGASSQSGR